MNNEYIIVNKSILLNKIIELKKEREEHEKVDIGMFDAIWAAKTSQAIDLLEELISISTPLIPEIEKAFDEGFNSEEEIYKGNPTGKIIGKKEYISNLKLDI